MVFENRRYVIIPALAITQVNFAEVLETAPETCRYSVDGAQTFVKYEGIMPPSVATIVGRSAEFTHDQMLVLLSTPEWQDPLPPSE